MVTTFTDARAHLAALLDRVTEQHETILITRRDREDVALIAASEPTGLLETVHLLRSPANAERLLAALDRARAATEPPATVENLRQELDLIDEQGIETAPDA